MRLGEPPDVENDSTYSRTTKERAKVRRKRKGPRWACYVSYMLLPLDRAKAVISTLEELYVNEWRPKLGVRRADRIFAWKALIEVFRHCGGLTFRLLFKLNFIKKVIEMVDSVRS